MKYTKNLVSFQKKFKITVSIIAITLAIIIVGKKMKEIKGNISDK